MLTFSQTNLLLLLLHQYNLKHSILAFFSFIEHRPRKAEICSGHLREHSAQNPQHCLIPKRIFQSLKGNPAEAALCLEISSQLASYIQKCVLKMLYAQLLHIIEAFVGIKHLLSKRV